MSANNENLVWVDLEMTGLDPEQDKIIEIASIVTDAQLNVLAEGPVVAISQPQELLDGMDDWNTEHHTRSGLLKRVIESEFSVTDAEQRTLEFVSQYLDSGKSPMCGNSICQDRRFMAKGMPELEAWFHYRNIDVSSIKELTRRWNPEVLNGFHKRGTHLALDDIRESIQELKYYRTHVFAI